MDTSEQFTKMCDTPEIQGQKPRMGLVPPTNEDTFISLFACYWAGDFDWIEQRSRYIWLPRQDQLQEMVGGGLENGFIDWQAWLENIYGLNYGDKPNGHLHIFKTWEQLWLAFVMKEKYGKTWHGSRRKGTQGAGAEEEWAHRKIRDRSCQPYQHTHRLGHP